MSRQVRSSPPSTGGVQACSKNGSPRMEATAASASANVAPPRRGPARAGGALAREAGGGSGPGTRRWLDGARRSPDADHGPRGARAPSVRDHRGPLLLPDEPVAVLLAEHPLADPVVQRSDLEELVVREELDGIVEREIA